MHSAARKAKKAHHENDFVLGVFIKLSNLSPANFNNSRVCAC